MASRLVSEGDFDSAFLLEEESQEQLLQYAGEVATSAAESTRRASLLETQVSVAASGTGTTLPAEGGVQTTTKIPPPWNRLFRRTSTFIALQAWEGVVVEVSDIDFTVRLFDKRNKMNPELSTAISIEELDDEERSLVEPGAYFYWSVGYCDTPSGRKRQSVVRFRRLPAWTSEEIRKAKEQAEDDFRYFGGEDGPQTAVKHGG